MLFPARTVRMSPREFAEPCPDRSSVKTARLSSPPAAGLFPASNVRASLDSNVSRSGLSNHVCNENENSLDLFFPSNIPKYSLFCLVGLE